MNFSNLAFIPWDVPSNVFPGLEIPKWYGVFWAAGILLGCQVMLFIYKAEGKSLKELDALTVYLIIGTIAGARLGHVLFYDPVYYWHHPIEILPFKLSPTFQFTGFAGLASHGGGLGIFVAIYLFCKRYKKNYLWLLDRMTIIVAIVGSFIRFGNLMNSEMIGIPTNVPWAFIFFQIDNLPRHPAQLYESIYCLALFMFMFWIWKNKRQTLPSGFMLGLFMILLFSLRFIDEFFKIDQEPFENGLPINMGQILSIPFIILGVLIVLKFRHPGVSNNS